MRKGILWALAVIITLGAAFYQRLTGPSYPVQGKALLDGLVVPYRLDRTAVNTHDHPVKVTVPDKSVIGVLEWKRLRTSDQWVRVDMERKGETLTADLPRQPMAGKLEYRVLLTKSNHEVSLTGSTPTVIRFRGSVPASLLIPHILIMFLAMLFSNRAGLAALNGRENPRALVWWTLALLVLGGFVFGPLVQKFSFGTYWTGFPLGSDLTDSKTLVMLLAWVVALVAGRKGRKARGWVLAAAAVTLVVFLIPHSWLGSELRYPNPHR
jgi:hypothetical protein